MTAQSRECPERTIDPDALARAIAAARRLKEEDPELYKSLPVEKGKQ
ncbi:hypothetical protein LN389_07580 [Enterobacter hormaechei subsp. steigerwaltii]|nr:hypothetical protein [Enterobacter hormaechei]HED6237946.1 hypothetical protein [Enterobacter sichuanensis]MCC9338011.1 hypothetical protein [Enterobacter hormaechei subsp. steigerwaltii]MCC9377774.1 hypothetical protein [Enterobacter hormaechei subsp. steigerwaltii]MCC9391111.1 hypothetical protein [Enterobacter hormaechei subsp. steigerwaltii]MCC9417950.1 hypothetical protein [Enterobacter hormaechei subsp. steigerwaltii]